MIKTETILEVLQEASYTELCLPHSDLHTSVNKQTNKMAVLN